VIQASSMPDRIRTADPEADRALLTDLLVQNLGPAAGDRRYDWLYLQSPYGRASVLVATENGSGRAIGAAAAFPRRLFVGGSVRDGYVLGDFCIDQHHRSLGLALQLQRACLEEIISAPLSVAYDFPSDRMMAIYRRMQISPAGQIVRWAKPLRVNRKIGNLVGLSALAGLLAAPVNELLKWKDFVSLPEGGWMIVEHKGACGKEFTDLAHSVGSGYGPCLERSAEYLNWRYVQHPLLRHELLVARRAQGLKGYVVFSHTDGDAKIVDLFGFSDTAMWTALVGRVVSFMRDRGVVTLSIPAMPSSPWASLLKGWGFRPREAAPVVVYDPGRATGSTEEASSWFLTDGDRES
jgi:GNAT superfamily N-acetyltransferase